MYKNKILADVKIMLGEKITKLDFSTLSQFEEEVAQFIEFLRMAERLPISLEETGKIQAPNEQMVKAKIENKENGSSDVLKDDASDKEEEVYEFKREIRGGIVLGLGPDGKYFIPEKMTEDMGLKNGYKLKITGKSEKDTRTSYHFDIVERNEKINKFRQQYNYCRVEKEAGELVVKEHQNGDIRLDEVPYTFIVNQNDVEMYNLKEGDIVDIAFSKEKPEKTMMVLRKHETEKVSALTVEQKKLGYTDRKVIDTMYEKDHVVDTSLFANKKILIVGGGTRRKNYLEALEELDSSVEHATGDEGKVRIASMISRADVVAISIGECSHDASLYAVSECKKQGVPFAWTDRNGIQSLLLCVEEALKRKNEIAS